MKKKYFPMLTLSDANPIDFHYGLGHATPENAHKQGISIHGKWRKSVIDGKKTLYIYLNQVIELWVGDNDLPDVDYTWEAK